MDKEKHPSVGEDDLHESDTPLRRPNITIIANNAAITAFQGLNLAGTIKPPDVKQTVHTESKLSADAKEWYPAGYKKPSAQDRLLKVKQNQPQHQSNSESNGVCLPETSEEDAFGVLLLLRDYINILIDDPGQFDVLLDQVVKILEPYYRTTDVLHDIAILIFSEAVEEPNFRYSAARLCRILEDNAPLFRTALHLRAQKLVQEASPEYERDLALTLAELFSQSNSDNLYGNFVVQSIEKIVSVATAENVKCVCQVLKLTGAALDMHHRSKMNSIFNQLEHVKPSLPSLVNLIDYVITLRASHWGQIDTSSYSVAPDDRCSLSEVDGPILYGPDGKELSEEETQFLSENCVDFFCDDLLDSDPDELYDPDNEIDEEGRAAFREFTKGSRE